MMNLRKWRDSLARAYLTIDGRSLALFRVMVASLMILDALRRVPWLRDLYSNAGLLPNHTTLWRPPAPRMFSVFFMASRTDEARLLLVVCIVCFFFFLVGWHTRLFQILSLALSASIHNRVLFAENASSVALSLLLFWTLFLPLGRRCSVDALLASLRAGRDEQPRDLAAGRLPPADRRPAVTLVALAILLQLATIYGFNYVHKTGPTWRDGTAIHYVLYQARIITWLGVVVREHLPFAGTKVLAYATLVIEASAPFLLLTPVFWRQTRALAIVLLTALHTGIALLINLGIFSPVMICYYPLLVDASHWDFVARRRRADEPRVIVLYDAGCGVCFEIVRVLARLDVRRRMAWRSNRDANAVPTGVDPALLEQTVVVIETSTGRRWTRSDAVARVFRELPGGWVWAWPFYVPGVGALAGIAYDAFARRRAAISAWLGFAACAVPAPEDREVADRHATSEAESAPSAGAWAHRLTARLRECAVAISLFVLGADVVASDAAVPQAIAWHTRPAWMVEPLMYLRLYENWGMFSPDAPMGDGMVVVEAVTQEGRRVDPFNEVGSRVSTLPVVDIPARLGQDSMFCDYTASLMRFGAYPGAFQEWILRYPERTGRPEDRIVSFEAIKLEHASPRPGQTQPTDVSRRVFMKYP